MGKKKVKRKRRHQIFYKISNRRIFAGAEQAFYARPCNPLLGRMDIPKP